MQLQAYGLQYRGNHVAIRDIDGVDQTRHQGHVPTHTHHLLEPVANLHSKYARPSDAFRQHELVGRRERTLDDISQVLSEKLR